MASGASAQETPAAPTANSGDTAFVLVSAALVMLMTPGLAFFYGGMVRRKNILGTIMHSMVALLIVSVTWVLFGYSMAFGPGLKGLEGFIGNPFAWLGLKGVGLEPHSTYGTTVPHQAFMAFQMMFAIITPALYSGAIAERMKFSTYVVFLVLWATLVYNPVCHWVWAADGWLSLKGALDFAGGTVVHMTAGYTALVMCLIMGKRKGYPTEPILPHSLPWTILGAGLLWFGWFGFNAGSALAANASATTAFVATNTAAAMAGLTWMLLDWMFVKKPTALGAASGIVAGLVAITPAAGFVTPIAAIAIGFLAGAICRQAVQIRARLKVDDSLDVVGVHGIGGTLGAIATGIFASQGGKTGLLTGNEGQLKVQLMGVGATLVYSIVVSFILLKILDVVMGLRVNERDEFEGLDLSQHGEAGYTE